MSIPQDGATDEFPLCQVDDRGRSSVSLATPRRSSSDTFELAFDGPAGEEMVVEFDAAYLDADIGRLVLTRRSAPGRRGTEVKVLQAEHWGQWAEVSDWFETHATEGIPRRLK